MSNILVPAASVWIETARRGAWLMAAGLGWEWAWRMSRIMAWCTGLALVGAVDRGARPGGPQQGRVRPGQLGVMRLGRQLRRRRDYRGRPGHQQGFVAGERNGRWGTAIEMPGPAA
jgi:hypothetical protein